MTDNTTESLVQADINDVLDNMSARNATLTRELAISQAQATALQRRVKELEAQLAEAKYPDTDNHFSESHSARGGFFHAQSRKETACICATSRIRE